MIHSTPSTWCPSSRVVEWKSFWEQEDHPASWVSKAVVPEPEGEAAGPSACLDDSERLH